jgi:hypothetical protein
MSIIVDASSRIMFAPFLFSTNHGSFFLVIVCAVLSVLHDGDVFPEENPSQKKGSASEGARSDFTLEDLFVNPEKKCV